MNNLAGTLKSLGRFQDAVAMFEKTLDFYRRTLPPNHPNIGLTFALLGLRRQLNLQALF
jgi:hypothetical protein